MKLIYRLSLAVCLGITSNALALEIEHWARAAASSALDAGAAGDYAGTHPDADVDELANLLMAWYYAGYYTGQYSKRGGGEDEAGEEGGD